MAISRTREPRSCPGLIDGAPRALGAGILRLANAELNLADTYLAKGDLTLTREFLDAVQRRVKDPATSDWMQWRYSTHLLASLGEFWLVRGVLTKAQECADRCLDLAGRTHSQKYLVKGWRLNGEIALICHRWDDAESAFRQALTIAHGISSPRQSLKTYLAIGRLHTKAKNPRAALRAYHAAREIIDRIKGGLQDPELRASLARDPLTQHVYGLTGAGTLVVGWCI